MLCAGRAGRMICVEKAAGAYGRARQRAATEGRITLLKGDGFAPLAAHGLHPRGVGMGGMGAATMSRILALAHSIKTLPEFLLLAPTGNPDAVLGTALELGYSALRWRWVPEGSRLVLVSLLRLDREAGGAGERERAENDAFHSAVPRVRDLGPGSVRREPDASKAESTEHAWWQPSANSDPLVARALCAALRVRARQRRQGESTCTKITKTKEGRL
jgi:hypothetical protein